jgi:peptide chain release factor 1
VHSSTVTVAVLDPLERRSVQFNDRDFKIEWYSGTGAGGQHRNKHQNSCRIVHLSSGVTASAQCRSRENSLAEARATILARLDTQLLQTQSSSRSELRRNQVGSGERGDKRRTYRFQDDRTKDHLTGREISTARAMQGDLDLLW